jgi:hypothetical protein
VTVSATYPLTTKDRTSGEEVPINFGHIYNWIGAARLPALVKNLLWGLLKYSDPSKEPGHEGEWTSYPSLMTLCRWVGPVRKSDKVVSKRHLRRNGLREAELLDCVRTHIVTGDTSRYVLWLPTLMEMAVRGHEEVARERRDAEANAPEASRPQHELPAWLPRIRQDEDRGDVAQMVELVLEGVLGRPAALEELHADVRLVLKLWRTRDCPDALLLAEQSGKIASAAAAGCKHKALLWLQGKGKDGYQWGRNYTRRPSSVLDPQKFEERLEAAELHHARGECGCRHAPVAGRMDEPVSYTDQELEQLKRKRQIVLETMVPLLERELRRHDPDLPGLAAELRGELADAAVVRQWPMLIERWLECAWQWLAERGAISRGPPSTETVS